MCSTISPLCHFATYCPQGIFLTMMGKIEKFALAQNTSVFLSCSS
ncbi:hypothetical protein D082_07560 [Synechocystis sp. PCC 6714]|nr:hypothetical protein D082_07560 [Synechocystis sp. PCC 6714]